jgi:hypothetical protein
VQPLDFPAFVNFLVAHGHNFTDLWKIELPELCSFPTSASGGTDFTIGPHPWQRTGPGNGTDGKPKFCGDACSVFPFHAGFPERIPRCFAEIVAHGIGNESQ